MAISEVFNEDCMIGMLRYPDKFFDLAIIDPPYGRKEHGGKNRSTAAVQKNGTQTLVKCGGYERKAWDENPPSDNYFKELFRVSKHQIIWGINYLGKNFGPGRIVWDKVNDGSDQSNCEIAYNSMTQRVDLFRYMWRGMMQGNKKLNEKRIHPTQKPVPLYQWLLGKYEMGGVRSWIRTWEVSPVGLRPTIWVLTTGVGKLILIISRMAISGLV